MKVFVGTQVVNSVTIVPLLKNFAVSSQNLSSSLSRITIIHFLQLNHFLHKLVDKPAYLVIGQCPPDVELVNTHLERDLLIFVVEVNLEFGEVDVFFISSVNSR